MQLRFAQNDIYEESYSELSEDGRNYETRLEMGLIHWFFAGASCCDGFRDTSPVKGESQRDRTLMLAVLQSPAPEQSLHFVVGAHGLDSLSYNGQSLLRSAQDGELQPQKSVFRAVLDALLSNSTSSSRDAE